MNLSALRRQLARIQTKVTATAEDMRFHIPAHSGMAGLRAALQAAAATRGEAKGEPDVGVCLGPISKLRRDILAEQKRRAELFAITPIEKLCEQPAIYETEEPSQCALPTRPNLET
jgi:hypothetical protein